MTRYRLGPALLAAGLIVVSALDGQAQQSEIGPTDPVSRRTMAFLDGLRDRGYHDLALEYIDRLRDDAATPAELKPILDFEEGRTVLIEAQSAPDLVRRAQLLEQARARFDAFLKDHPSHPMAPEARVQLAEILYQRGQNAALAADDAADDAARQAALASARAAFDEARKAFEEAITQLQNAYDAFPVGFLEEDDPVRAAREEAHRHLIDAKLKRALVDYEQAQTYPEGSDDRNRLLDTAIAAFNELYNSYRTWMAGFAARMWEGKSFEEKGQIREAMGIYDELLGHDDPRLRPLQRQVAFFKVIAHRKREEYPLAERLAREWLALSRGDTGSYERLGVQLELARNIDAQLDAKYPPAVARREELVADLVQNLSEVVQYASPYKADAAALLKEYRPMAEIDRRDLAALRFEQCMERGREAMGTESWNAAVTYFRAALSKIDPARQTDEANQARYLLAFCLYREQRYYEAAVLADFLARRYPDWPSTLPASELGLSAMALAYESVDGPGAVSDLRRLQGLADYVITTWPNEPQADVARILKGDIALGQGHYIEAAESYESVQSPARKLDAQSKAAAAHWRRSLVLRKEAEDGTSIPAEAVEESKKARELLQSAYQARLEARVPPTDPDRVQNVGDLAEIHLAERRAPEAIELLKPHVEALAKADLNDATRPLYARLLKLQLQAHIAAGQTDAAIADMKALEAANTGAPLAQLFFGLGRLLEDEMEAQRQSGNLSALETTRRAYQRFLDALVSSESGQSFQSLQWAGEQMLSLGRPDRAIAIFQRILEEYPNHELVPRTKLKLSAAYRGAKKFREAWNVTAKMVAANPRSLDFLMEKAQVLEDWAQEEPGYWNHAIREWQDLARQLGNARPRPSEYYECWYHVAWCQYQKGSQDSARRTLKSVKALSPSLGSPEMKQKYEQLLQRVGG